MKHVSIQKSMLLAEGRGTIIQIRKRISYRFQVPELK